MKVLKNNKGIALVMVLVLSAIALAIMAALIYMATTGTQVSGLQKRYSTALEGGMAGAEIVFEIIGERKKLTFSPPLQNPIYYPPTFTNACMMAKLTTQTTAANWAPCGSITDPSSKPISSTIIPGDSTTPKGDEASYDLQFDLGPGPVLDPKGIYTYQVYAKITETVEGNTSPDSGWVQGGVVWSKSEFYPIPSPYYYAIEVLAVKRNQESPERAKLSILYQH